MLGNKAIAIKGLQKQAHSLNSDPITGILVKRDGFLDFYFVIYGLQAPYENGFYFGLLKLHQNYPFAAPQLLMFTASGRFETNLSICTSFTNYHQESWTSAWNVRSLLLGTVSFMTSQEASYGCRNDSAATRAFLAQKSIENNLKNAKFCQLFLEEIKGKNIVPNIQQKLLELQTKSTKINIHNAIDQIALQNDPQNRLLAPEDNNNQQRNCRRKICGVILLVLIAFVLVLII